MTLEKLRSRLQRMAPTDFVPSIHPDPSQHPNQRRRRVLLTVDDGFVVYVDPPDAIYDPETKISPKIRFPHEISCESMRILGSCDGLICFCSTGSYGNKLFLFNPSTGKYASRCAGEELSLRILGGGVLDKIRRHRGVWRVQIVGSGIGTISKWG